MNLLQYQPGDSFLHRLNPLTKLAAAFLYGAACIVSGNVFLVTALILLMLLIAATAGLGARAVKLTRNLLILGLFMFVIQLFFVRSGDPLLRVGSMTVVTTGGLTSALLLSLRVVAAMLPLMLLFAITEVSDLCGALVKKLHVPYRYAFIVTTASGLCRCSPPSSTTLRTPSGREGSNTTPVTSLKRCSWWRRSLCRCSPPACGRWTPGRSAPKCGGLTSGPIKAATSSTRSTRRISRRWRLSWG